MKGKVYDLKIVQSRIENYCAREDRCQQQVLEKLRGFGLSEGIVEDFLITLIQNNYVNEERYARSFCSGKFKIKKWGRRKITFELKKKKVSDACIQKGLEELDEEAYLATLQQLIEKKNKLLKDKNPFVRKKKIVDYLVRKGYEPDYAWERVRSL